MRNTHDQTASRTSQELHWPSRIMRLTRVLAGILFFALLHNPARALTTTLPGPYGVTLKWDPSPSAGVAGYRIYYGTASGNYTNSVAVGNVTTHTVPFPPGGVTYFFAVRAVGATGLESDFSNEVRDARGIPSVQMHAVPNGQFILTLTGTMGHTYDIEATEDFTTWTVIGRVILEASGSFDFIDTKAADFAKRFYRAHDIQRQLSPVNWSTFPAKSSPSEERTAPGPGRHASSGSPLVSCDGIRRSWG